ncbi:hypothetical protein LJB93_03080 [Desulfovibrio sp. OttesenSCG-928-F07]|nr:hypothetical protein [Desulfovibrio sp. OttesenSCG-928-F07]
MALATRSVTPLSGSPYLQEFLAKGAGGGIGSGSGRSSNNNGSGSLGSDSNSTMNSGMNILDALSNSGGGAASSYTSPLANFGSSMAYNPANPAGMGLDLGFGLNTTSAGSAGSSTPMLSSVQGALTNMFPSLSGGASSAASTAGSASSTAGSGLNLGFGLGSSSASSGGGLGALAGSSASSAGGAASSVAGGAGGSLLGGMSMAVPIAGAAVLGAAALSKVAHNKGYSTQDIKHAWTEPLYGSWHDLKNGDYRSLLKRAGGPSGFLASITDSDDDKYDTIKATFGPLGGLFNWGFKGANTLDLIRAFSGSQEQEW